METGFPGDVMVKNLPANSRDKRDTVFGPGWRRSPGGGVHSIFFPGETHGQRNLAGQLSNMQAMETSVWLTLVKFSL